LEETTAKTQILPAQMRINKANTRPKPLKRSKTSTGTIFGRYARVYKKLMACDSHWVCQLILCQPTCKLTDAMPRAARFKIIGVVNSKQVTHLLPFNERKSIKYFLNVKYKIKKHAPKKLFDGDLGYILCPVGFFGGGAARHRQGYG
jgi:hypothetical protein